MGLTVQYSITSTARKVERARELVEKMRQVCMDLAFYKVHDVIELHGADCDYNNPKYDPPKDKRCKDKHEALRWLLIQSMQSIDIPWSKNRGRDKYRENRHGKLERNRIGEASTSVSPTHVIACNVWGLAGSEPMNVGLCKYPAEIEREYSPEDDARFRSFGDRHGFYGYGLDYDKWNRYRRRQGWWPGDERYWSGSDCHKEKRKIKTGIGSRWYWSSFCKTQYASDPRCGGIPNFLAAHISTVTALERIAALPTIKVEIGDEGEYGPHESCPDWREADEEGRERVYVPHEGYHDPAKLAKEVGEWNTMIAAQTGALKDMLPGNMALESAIAQYPNFEQLEHFGRLNADDDRVGPFIQHMGALAKAIAKQTEEEAKQGN